MSTARSIPSSALGQLRRVLAQVEVTFSNSMIELVAYYVEQHNTVLPHAAFAGQTPDEMYFGCGDHVPGELAAGHARARAARLESNRQLSCGACRPPVRDPSGLPDPSANSRVLQVHDEMSGMS
jgi:hypothetical protein